MTATDPSAPPDHGTRRRLPRFNHVAMSMPADALDDQGRAEILAFYGDVFGWEEAPGMTEDRRRLVLMCHRFDQFVFLIADDAPMQAPRLDHFGLSVGTREELVEWRDKVAAWAERDDRVDLIDINAEEHPGVRITAFYVRYLLPMMVEVQYWEWL